MAVEQARQLPHAQFVFLNTHSIELQSNRTLLETLRPLAGEFREGQKAVLEISEQALINLHAIAELREALQDQGIGLAYDDFGTGQSRLMEMAEVPPDFAKLDMRLVRGIDRARTRKQFIAGLVHVMHSVGSKVVAEGIETFPEAEVCHSLGCDYGQGFHFARPTNAAACAAAVGLRLDGATGASNNQV
jgi:EAL domain-containing protein (putative c-di-GMP-specific phosphodiesterase class I)